MLIEPDIINFLGLVIWILSCFKVNEIFAVAFLTRLKLGEANPSIKFCVVTVYFVFTSYLKHIYMEGENSAFVSLSTRLSNISLDRQVFLY